MVTLASHKTCGALLDLDDVKQSLGLVEQSPSVGIRPIAVKQIVGTVGRCSDFDRCFHPLRSSIRDRMHRVEAAFPDGDFPPIVVFQIDQTYFVSDGHHRVALARRIGVEYIDAIVTLIHGPYRLESDVERAQVEITGYERLFLEQSGLSPVRPGARIFASSGASYGELLEAVKAHGYDLIQEQERPLRPEHVAAHWYDCVFRPTLQAADEAGLRDLMPSCRDGDMFIWLHRSHQRAFGTECAAAEDAIQQAAAAEKERATSSRPRFLQWLFTPRHRSPPASPLQRRK